MTEQRGRKPRGNYKQKTHVFSTRITADLRDALGSAAIESKHSLSQEVEQRLRRSFLNDREIMSVFGNRRNYAVLRMISSLMEMIRNPAAPDIDWLDDPYSFDQLLKAISMVLEELRPPGDRVPPHLADPIEARVAELQPNIVAGELLFAVKDASAELPLSSSSPAPLIHADLGDAAARIGGPRRGRRLVQGTSADFRKAAKEMEQEEAEGDNQ